MAPSFKNNVNYRFAWHLETIRQQQYTNYRVIIVDDASGDGTWERISKHLRWRNFSKDKFIVIRNRERRTAVENIYYITHKYCDYNQLAYIVDGDDELIGTQVLRLFNTMYQRHKLYVLYSNWLGYDFYYPKTPLSVGVSQAFP